MNALQYRLSYRKKLPHVQPPAVILFVTFRLAGSLPKSKIMELMALRDDMEGCLTQLADPEERALKAYEEQKRLFAAWDRCLDDSKEGPRWLGQARIAKIMMNALHYLDGQVYELDTFCVMSNHVHVIFSPLEKEDGTYHALAAIMHSLKRYTARRANKSLGRDGQFWQHESYDHVVRDEAELQRIRRYVLENPVKAGLVDDWRQWPWSYCRACQE